MKVKTDSYCWALFRGGNVLTAAPHGWLENDLQLLKYVRAAAEFCQFHVAFHWTQGKERRLHRIEFDVRPVSDSSVQPRLVEVSLQEINAPYGLTSREFEVLTLVAGGLTNPDIAQRLAMSRRTVATHIERLLMKLDVPSRAAAAAIAVDQDLYLLPIHGGGDGLAPLRVRELECAATRQPTGRDTASTNMASAPSWRQPHPHPITVGAIYPLHGVAAADGRARYQAAELAIGEINRSGGIGSRPLMQVAVDADVTDQRALADGIDTLINRGVDAITVGYALLQDDFGNVFSHASQARVPLLHSATSAMAQQLVLQEPDRFGNLFQVCAPETRYGIGFIRTLNELRDSRAWTPPNRKLLVIDSANRNITTFTEQAYDHAVRSGWRVNRENVDFVRPDWNDTLRQLDRLDPAAVMIASWIEDGLLAVLRRLHATGSAALVYGVYAPSIPGFIQRAGHLADGLLWSTVIGLYNDHLGQNFLRAYLGRYNSEPGHSGAGIHYDMIHILTHAYRQAPNPHDHSAVITSLRRTVHRGVSGAYYFGEQGQSALTYPDDTPDPSIAQAHLVHQIQAGRHVIIAPEPYVTGRFQLPRANTNRRRRGSDPAAARDMSSSDTG